MKYKFICTLLTSSSILSVLETYALTPEYTVIRISPGCSGKSEFYDLDAGIFPPPLDVVYPDFDDEAFQESEETIYPEADELLPV